MRQDSVGCRRCDVVVSAQGGDGVKQLTPVADDTDAQILQVLRRQVRQDRLIDLVLAESGLVPFEAKAPQLTVDVQFSTLGLL